MIIKENEKWKVINAYGLTGYFDTYDEALSFYKDSLENCESDN